MSDKVSQFLETVRKFESVETELRDIEETLRSASNIINRNLWPTTGFDPTGEIESANPIPEIDVDNTAWPTPKRVAELISEFHRLYELQHELWDGLDEAERAGLKQPILRFI